jgi:sugar phosphate isomerase/epimerase
MFILSGFADEISPDLNSQLDTLDALGIRYLELRGIWDTGVLSLSDDQVEKAKAEMDRRGIEVSAIGSPIGKIKIEDPFEPHLKDFRRALHLAEFFGAPYIRMFSFFVPEGQADRHRSQVMERLRALLDLAQGHDVTLVHENEKNIYGDIPRRCRDIVDTMASSQIKITFDPANFVQCGVRPFSEAYGLLEDQIAYLHIKDARMADKSVVPAGQGDGQVQEILAATVARGYGGQAADLFVSLEPHLKSGGPFRGFSGPDLFETAARALRHLMKQVGAHERH